VHIVATDPATPVILNKFEKLNIRVGYSSDRRVRVRVEPFYGETPLPSLTGGAASYEAGEGEAYFWISYDNAVKINRAQITLLDDETNKPMATADAALDVSWSGVATGVIRPDADWARRMRLDSERQGKEDFARREAKRLALGGARTGAVLDIVMAAGAWMVPGYFILQAVFLLRWKGGWRTAALIPLVPMSLVLGFVFYATVVRGSNIAPVIIVFTAPVGLVFLVVLWLLRRSAIKAATA
jgi:hypothetical protein